MDSPWLGVSSLLLGIMEKHSFFSPLWRIFYAVAPPSMTRVPFMKLESPLASGELVYDMNGDIVCRESGTDK